MADILFITPNFQGNINDESTGTILLATILRDKGIDAEILPFARFGDPSEFPTFLNTATDMIVESNAKIVSFYTRCDCYHIMIKLASCIKERKNVYIVFGGPQADISAIDTVRLIPYVDFVCCGEGEYTIYPFVSSLLQGQPDLSVPGLTYRLNGQVVQNPRPALIEDLDAIPDADYSIVGLKASDSNRQAFPIDVGRGCPFGCTYCSTKSFWGRKYRLKTPYRIYSEMKRLHEQYNITYFAFEHDMFTLNRAQVIETCGLLRTLDFPVKWKCSARIDCLDEELIDIMVESGLIKLYIGIETGSPRMQKVINKNLKLDNVIHILRYIQSKGIHIVTSFVYGFPEETEADLSQTIALIAELAKLKNITIQRHLCTFLPGTELSNRYLSELTPAQHYSDITGTVALAECQDLIQTYPQLFVHFWEYNTPLRSKLEYFSTFIKMWTLMQPVYAYFSEQYPRDRLVDMYFDFVRANQEILEKTKALSVPEQAAQIITNDRFAERFSNSEYSDIVRDYYRFVSLKYYDQTAKSHPVTEILCFSPLDIDRCARIQDYTRRICLVTATRAQDNTVQIKIMGRK